MCAITHLRTARFGPSLLLIVALSSLGCTAAVARARAAADFSCREDQLEVEQLPGQAFRIRGCGKEATYACSGGGHSGSYDWLGSPVSCMRETPTTTTTTTTDGQRAHLPAATSFPKGAAGFDFGLSRASAETACTAAGHVASPGENEHGFVCSAPAASVGFDARVTLSFCEDKLCRIDIDARSDTSDEWAKRFVKLREVLEKRYGRPIDTREKVSDRCASATATCLAEGTAAAWITWRWQGGSDILLTMGKFGDSPTLRITYKREFPESDLAL